MKKCKRILSVLLAVVMLVCPVPVVNVGAATSTPYYNWKQYDSQWSGNYIGTKTIGAIGCAATSVAMLIVQAGFRSESNFDPGTFVSEMKAVGGFSNNDIYWGKVSQISGCSGFTYVGNYSLPGTASGNVSKIKEKVDAGYSVVVSVKGGGHYVAVRSASSSSVTMMDPASTNTDLYGYYSASNSTKMFVYQGNAVHTHSYGTYYEGAHPHKYYKQCSCGAWYYTGQNAAVMTPGYEAIHPHRCYDTCSICKQNFLNGKTTTVSSCLECNRPSKPSVNNLKSTYCSAQNITFTWKATTNTTHYNVLIHVKRNGEWKYLQWTSYASSGISYRLGAGEYRVEIQSYNSNKWESDNSDWLHTLSDWQYFTVVDHSYNAGAVTVPASCTVTGVRTYTCTLCNATKTEPIPVNASNHVNTTNVAATASTCTVKGYTAGVYCNDCKKYISGHVEQPLAAHQTTIINAREATYDAAGYTGDTYCTVCRQTLSYGTSIPKLTKPENPTNPTNPTQPTNPAQPSSQQQQSGGCKYCGGTHTGFPGILVGFFHSILALFGLRK